MKALSRSLLVVGLVALVVAVLVVVHPWSDDSGDDPAHRTLPQEPETQRPVPERATRVRIASFNLLGHSHTQRGGHSAELGPGPKRMRQALRILDDHGVDVVGLQELQPPQHEVLAATEGWAMFPGATNRRGMPNSVAWRTAVFDVVEQHLVDIPYFFGNIRPMPYVLLEHRRTGQRLWVGNFHNPADNLGPASKWRRKAVDREVELANRLERQTGHPVFFTGDMNERETYFCAMTRRTNLRSASGGSNDGECIPPEPSRIDWILGSEQVVFTDYVADRSPLVERTTDHPVIVATAHIPRRRG